MRRKRFHATVVDAGFKRKITIMAYTPESARRWLETSGYIVLRLSAAKRRKSIAAGKAAAWEIDQRALQSAMDKLDVTWKVRITRTASRTKLGAHRLRYREPMHRPQHSITVDKTVSPTEATRILWHELCHAAQAERAARKFATEAGCPVGALTGRECLTAWREDNARSRRYSYDARPIEIEARYISEINKQYLLTKAPR
jgi:hypothetical protein